MSLRSIENGIVATMLSGNSEAVVGEALESVVEWVDLLLLIDTGITDNTLEIARRIAGDKLCCREFAWCNDFARARNFSLQAAAEVGAKWALTIDTDERLNFASYPGIESLREALTVDAAVMSWLVPTRDGSYAKERFIRVPSHLEWKGRTHEALVGAAVAERKRLDGVTFFEERKTPEQFRHKLQRDLEVLREETQAQPENARWWFYLGQTLESLGEHGEAIASYRRCFDIRDGWREQAAWSAFRAANCYLQLDDIESALEICALGLARQAATPELAWLAGFCCYRLGRNQDAVAWEEMAISIGCVEGSGAAERRVGFRDVTAWYEGPYDVLRFAHRQLGHVQQASTCERKYWQARTANRKDRVTNSAATASGESTPARSPPTRHTRVAVLGLYSSGSSAVAGILHYLDVHLGHEYWGNHFEARWLAEQLRTWWREPDLEEQTPAAERVRLLNRWISDQEHGGASRIGAKHPLLTLCGDDLVAAWGENTKFLWSYRSLDDSIGSLERRGWWPGKERTIQNKLWETAHEFFSRQEHLKVYFDRLIQDPELELKRIVAFLELEAPDDQLAAALASIERRSAK